MGCSQSGLPPINPSGKREVWACQYCGQQFNTYQEADQHERFQCPRRPGAAAGGVAPVAAYQPGGQPGYQPGGQPGYQPGGQPGYKPGGQPGYQPGQPAAQQGQPTQMKCGNCGQVFGAPAGYAQVKCPKCGQVNALPAAPKIPVQVHNQQLGLTPVPTNQPTPSATGKRRALFVGCNYPGTQAELRGCINDVRKMRQLLAQMYGFPMDSNSCMVLVDDGSGPAPTRANILNGFRWLAQGAQPGDCLFFHFSGHGAQQQDPNCMEEDGYDETICPTDFNSAGMIVDDEIFDNIVAPLPSGCKLTAVMDCCHSGTGMDLPFIYERGRFTEEDNPCHSAGDVMMISGCQDQQTSSDGGGAYGRPMGAMTSALTSTLERNRNLTISQLHQELHNELSRGGFEQRPSITTSQNFDPNSRLFHMSDNFIPNSNAQLGRQFRKKKHPRNNALLDGNLGAMLMAGAVGFMLADVGGDIAVGMAMGGAAVMSAGADAMFDAGGGGFMGGMMGGFLGGDGGDGGGWGDGDGGGWGDGDGDG